MHKLIQPCLDVIKQVLEMFLTESMMDLLDTQIFGSREAVRT